MKNFLSLIAVAAITTVSASADVIPYNNIHHVAPTNTFTATSTGDVVAYFYATDASFNSKIGMLVNGVSTGLFGLKNHNSIKGQSFDLGHANAGDTLVFELQVTNLGHSWFSNPALNSDHVNHTYSTSFSGDNLIPAGTYIAFEDSTNGGDLDYNDHQFVIANATNAPDAGSTLMLLGSALVGFETLRRKFRA